MWGMNTFHYFPYSYLDLKNMSDEASMSLVNQHTEAHPFGFGQAETVLEKL